MKTVLIFSSFPREGHYKAVCPAHFSDITKEELSKYSIDVIEVDAINHMVTTFNRWPDSQTNMMTTAEVIKEFRESSVPRSKLTDISFEYVDSPDVWFYSKLEKEEEPRKIE